MLNQDLIKQFKHIKDGTMTGVLRLQEGERIIRFYFEDGSLLLMDFGIDKEMLMADQFIAYHMIDDAMGQYAKTMYNDQQAPISETLLKQQLVSQGEVDQVTRSMVEEILCHAFSNTHNTSWQSEQDVDTASFDLNKTSVKIRIDIDMLLSMVQSRIQERDAVRARLEDWNIVYSFEEDSPPDAQLNDMERNVLRFVDGRQSVKDIARSMRETAMNIGIYLCSLENQRFIRKGGIRQSTQLAVSAPTTVAAEDGQQAEAAASADASPFPDDEAPAATSGTGSQERGTGDFEVYSSAYKREEQKSSLGSIILILFILVAGGVGYAVWSSSNAQHKQELLNKEIRARITNGDWNDAEVLVTEAKELAGNDQVTQKRIKDMVKEIRKSFEKDFEEIRALIDEKNYKASQDRIGHYPLGDVAIAFNNLWDEKSAKALKILRTDAETLEAELDEEGEAFAADIRSALRSNNVPIAMQRLNNKPSDFHQSGWDYVTQRAKTILSRWRSDTLNNVENDDKSYKWKFRQLKNVEMANPNEREQQRIEELTSILTEQRNKLLKRLDDVPVLLKTGDYIGAGTILTQLEENSSALPDDKAGKVLELMAEKNDLESDLNGKKTALITQIKTSLTKDPLNKASEGVTAAVGKYTALPDQEEMQALSETAKLALAAIGAGKIKDEIVELEKISPDHAGINYELITNRIEYLTIQVKSANNKLDEIKKQTREGAIDEAIVELNSFIANDNYQRTVAIAEAKLMLKTQLALQKENEIIYKKFEDAILKDDVELVSKLLPKVKQKSLPFVVSSVPSGAKIWLNGVDTGEVTPKMYPPSSNADRAEMKFTLEKDGYRRQDITPLKAGSSWRIRAILQRKPIVELNLEESINSSLAVIGDELWVSSNKSVWKITKDGKSTSYKLENRASTIYAAAMKAEGNVYVPTRDRVVIRIDDEGKVSNLPVSLSSDHPILHFVSDVIIDGEFIVMIDAVSGDIHAVNEMDSKTQWTHKGDDRPACAPILLEDKMLVLYRNGVCKTIDVNSGDVVAQAKFDNVMTSAWSGADKLFGYSGKNLVAWDGKETIVEPLFKDIVNGGPGVIKTKDNRIRVPNQNGRFDVVLGRITDDLTGRPILWNNHAVVPIGNTMHILGPRGFSIEATKPMLEPILFGDLLIVASSDGQIRFLKQ